MSVFYSYINRSLDVTDITASSKFPVWEIFKCKNLFTIMFIVIKLIWH